MVFPARFPRAARRVSIACSLARLAGLVIAVLVALARGSSAQVVISQVYTPSTGMYVQGYVELHNTTNAPIDLSTAPGWSIHIANAASSGTYAKIVLAGTIPAHGYRLLVPASPISPFGFGLPAVDQAIGTIDAKIALVNASAATLSVACPPVVSGGGSIVDYVGIGTAASCREPLAGGTSLNNAPALDGVNAIHRRLCGDGDSNDNAADWVLGMPNPRHALVAPQAGLTGFAWAAPVRVENGQPVLLRVLLRACAGGGVLGATVSGDLTQIGGTASQAFVDDGTQGDEVAGDGIYSCAITTNGVVLPNPGKSLPIQFSSGSLTGGTRLLVSLSDGVLAADACQNAVAIAPSGTPGTSGSYGTSTPSVTGTLPKFGEDYNFVANPYDSTNHAMDMIAGAPLVSPAQPRRGLWYSVVGTGTTMTAELCGSSPAFDSVISVMGGTCDGLTPVAGGDYGCGSQARATWCSSAGTNYYVWVAQKLPTPPVSNTFDLKILDDGVPCSGALSVDVCQPTCPSGALVENETAAGPASNDGCDAATTSPSSAQVFDALALTPGVTLNMCGTSRAVNSKTDPDWYRFQAPATGQLAVLAQGQFPLSLQVRQLSATGTCTTNTLVTGLATWRCQSALLTAGVTAGSWYAVRVAPDVTSGFFVGATSTKYTLGITLNAVPTNETCATALPIPSAGTSGIAVDTTSAALDGSASGCSVPVDHDVWYSFRPIADATWRISTCTSTNIDTVVEVFDGCGGSLIGCNDDTPGCGGGTRSTVVAVLSSLTTYRIRVARKGNPAPGGIVTLSVAVTTPVNDTCAGALPLAVPSSSTITTEGATAEAPAPPACSGPIGGSPQNFTYVPGVWYTLVSPLTQTVTVDTYGTVGVFAAVGFNTRIWVFQGSCGALSCVTANDQLNSGSNTSKVSFVAQAGTTYRILVGIDQTAGIVQLNVGASPTPVNDLCSSPATIAGVSGSISGTTLGATGPNNTAAAALPTCASPLVFNPFFDVWYSYTAPCSGTVRFGVCGWSGYVTVHSSCPTLTASNRIGTGCGGCGSSAEVSVAVTAGTTYLVRVAPAYGELPGGPFLLNWSLVDDAPPTITSCGPDPTLAAGPACTAVLPDLTGQVVVLGESCGPNVVTQSPTAGTVLGLGATQVTFTVTDPLNHVATCQRTVTVADQTPPAITCPGAQSISSGTLCTPLPNYVPLATTSDNCSVVTVSQSPPAGTLVTSGVTNVVLTATDAAANANSCTIAVTVTGPPAPTTLYVDDDFTGLSPGTDPPGPATYFGCDSFAKIQHALDRAPAGGLVLVAAGTYIEELAVAKTLELRGPNAGIDGASPSRGPEARVIPSVSLTGVQSLVTISAPSVVIDGMAFDGENTAITSPYTAFGANFDMDIGIHAIPGVDNDGLIVRNNVVVNMYWDGIAVGSTGGPSRAARIEHNKIDNVAWVAGVECYNDYYAAIENNTFTRTMRGARIGPFTQAKPVGSIASVANNTITNEPITILGQGTYSDVGGVLIIDHGLSASAWTVAGNGITNTTNNSANSHGIEVYDIRDAVSMVIVGNTLTGFQNGYSLWDCHASSPLTVQGGIVTGGVAAVHASNRNVYFSDTQFSCSYVVSGVTCTSTTGSGVVVQDHPSNPTAATVTVRVDGDCGISGWTNGILVSGTDARATVRDNTTGISGSQRGVWVDGGRALLENNKLTGSGQAAIRVGNGGLLDAGDPLGTNVSGLGTGSGPNGSSSGGNVLTGYGFENVAPWAVEDLNSLAQPDVLAFGNTFGAALGDNIEDVVFDDSDDATKSRVFASQAGGFLITCPPTLSVGAPTALASLPAGATTLAAFMSLGGSSSATAVTISSSDVVASGTPPCPYTATRTYTLTDPFGNVQTCVQTITVGQVDSDGDGVVNCLDGCPNDPLKTAPGVCGCGVADTDSDLDGTPNCNDGCPNDPAKIAPGQCGCGVADTDTDGDGTANCNDGCPNDPAKTAPGQCGCGSPDTDTDGDGTANCVDGCPNDPAKIAPGQCGCGNPDTDTDGDGTANCNDGCPTDPLKTTPGLCGCGTADTDTDSDGIPDCLDNCDAIANPSQADCDNDGIGDPCAIAGGALDCNVNGVPDACDLVLQTSLDVNANTVPDECEPDPGVAFCPGDGSGTPCPCGNTGAAGRGCANSNPGSQGARLRAFGVPSLSADTIQLTCIAMSGPGLFFQGSGQFAGGNGIAFGDGLLCAGGTITRMGVVFPLGGNASYPGGLTPNPVSVAGMIAAPGTFHYQCWYRDSLVFCSVQTYNLTQGLTLVWGP